MDLSSSIFDYVLALVFTTARFHRSKSANDVAVDLLGRRHRSTRIANEKPQLKGAISYPLHFCKKNQNTTIKWTTPQPSNDVRRRPAIADDARRSPSECGRRWRRRGIPASVIASRTRTDDDDDDGGKAINAGGGAPCAIGNAATTTTQ